MENIGLFICSIVGYLVIWEVWDMFFKNKNFKECLNSVYLFGSVGLNSDLNVKRFFNKIFILAILCAPFNVDGSVYTIAGNATGKNVYSIFSVYQRADDDVYNFLGTGYQKAGKKAMSIVGINFYQEVIGGNEEEDMVSTIIGIVGYQKANRTGVGIGIVGYQNAHDPVVMFGVGGYQVATNKALVLLGIAGYQRSEQGSAAPIVFYQKSNKYVGAFLAFYQNADKEASAAFFTFYQRVGNVTRSFVTFSETKADEAEVPDSSNDKKSGSK